MITTDLIYSISVWLLTVLIAIIFHEAAHRYVAYFLGDDTASRRGRASLNPVRHIDPFGTIILPGLLLLARSSLFGYAKPVPVNFRALHPPRIGMVLVAAAGPAMNIGLAVAAALAFPLIVYLLSGRRQQKFIWTKAAEVKLSTDFQTRLISGRVLPRDRPLTPLFALLPSFLGGTR